MFAKMLNFFHILDIKSTIEPVSEPTSAMPLEASARSSVPNGMVLERGNYSILDAKGYVLVAHITMPDVRKLAPQIAKEGHQCVRILKHAG